MNPAEQTASREEPMMGVYVYRDDTGKLHADKKLEATNVPQADALVKVGYVFSAELTKKAQAEAEAKAKADANAS